MSATKPRRPRRLPQPTHHKPSGQVRVRLQGKDHYFGRWDDEDSHSRALEFIGCYLANGRQLPAEDSKSNDLEVDDLLATYWERRVEGYYVHPDDRPTSEPACIRSALRPLHELFGSKRVSEFTPQDLDLVRRKMLSEHLARTTINGYINRIRRVFRWGTSQGLVPVTVSQTLCTMESLAKGRSKARETTPVSPVPLNDVEAILPHVSCEVAAMVQLMVLTGMRPGEVTIMRVRDLDMSTPVWEYRPAAHKTSWRGKERFVMLGPKAQAIVRPFLRAAPNAYLFSPRAAEERRGRRRSDLRNTPLRPPQERRPQVASPNTRRGEHYSTASLRRAIQRGCSRAGISRFAPNQIRHSAATAIRRRHGIDAAQQVLGHASPDTTAIYAESTRQRVSEIMLADG